MQTTCPEAMYLYGGEDFISHFDVEENSVVGIGPGLGTDPETENTFLEFLKNYRKPLVLDADALNKLMQKDDRLLTKIFHRISNELEAMGAVSKRVFWDVADHFLVGAKRIDNGIQFLLRSGKSAVFGINPLNDFIQKSAVFFANSRCRANLV